MTQSEQSTLGDELLQILKNQMSEHGVEPHWCKDTDCEASRQTALFFTDTTQALTQYIQQAVLKGKIDELEQLHRYDGKDYDTELDEVIDDRITELKEKL